MAVGCGAVEPVDPAAVAVAGPVDPPRHHPWRWAVLAGAAVGLTVVAVRAPGAVHDAAQAVGRLHRLDLDWLAVAVVVEVASMAAFAELQRRLLRVGGRPPGAGSVFAITLAGNALAQTLLGPGSLVAAGYTVTQYRRRGVDTALALWAVFVAGMVASVALIAAALVGVGATGAVDPVVAAVLGAVLAVGVPGFWMLTTRPAALAGLVRGSSRLYQRATHLPRSVSWVETVAGRLAGLHPTPGEWTVAGVFGAATWLADFAALAAGFVAIVGAGHLPWRALVLAYLAGQAGLLLRLTPGGLGLAEGGLVGVLTAYHVPVATAVAATALYRLVSLWGVVALGWASYGLLARTRPAGQPRDEGQQPRQHLVEHGQQPVPDAG